MINNPMQQQQMGGMGGTPELTDEELRKLALLLQQMPQGEGLATINQQEAQLLKDYGGSGTPLPGTQGLGPVGGPVRSYDELEEPGSAVGTGNGGNGGNGGSPTSPSSTDVQAPTTTTDFGYDVGEYDEGGEAGIDPDILYPDTTTTTTTTDDGGGGTPPIVVPPPKYYDKNGVEHSSQELAAAADVAIDTTTTAIEGLVLKTDQNFKSWMLANKETYPVPPSTEVQLETAFNNAKIKATDAAALQLPKMVDSMNVYLRENGAEVPFDTWWKTITTKPANLSETTMRTIYEKAVFKAERKEAFTLTPAEVAEFVRPAIQVATAGNFEEWWAGQGGLSNFEEWWSGQGGAGGLYKTKALALVAHKAAIEEARAAHTAAQVGDAKAVTVDEATEATAPTIGAITAPDAVTVETTGDVDQTTVDAISSVTDADMDAIFAGGIDEAEALLVARVEGTAVSPAEVQLKRSVENNLRMLLGATVGGNADPARVRQLKNIWADMTQEVTGKAAEIRSAESMAAEKELVALYKGKSTMKLQQRLSNLEVERQTAFKNGDMELAGKLTNQQTRLTEVITQANIDTTLSEADLKSRTDAMIAQGTMDLGTSLANLQMRKETALAQGKTDLAISLSNLQKNIVLATTNVQVAVQQRGMDDAIAIAAFKGDMALMGLEVAIDVEQMKADLTIMGFKLSRDLAELDSETQIRVAELTKDWREAQGDDQKQAAIIAALGTVLAGWASSDIRAKTNISPGSGEVESFLDALNAYTYEYKDPDAPGSDAGMFTGVMAQDLEKTPMGASFVQDTPNGKMVDYGHGLAAILASQANIHDRLKQLEEV
jgi:hypothetical protein